MKTKPLPTLEEVQKHLRYEDGVLYRVSGKSGVGKRAGHRHRDGYRSVRINDIDYMEHRIVWLLCTGLAPIDQIDHVNHCRDDNRIENLRECSQSQNSANRANNACLKGVTRKRRKFQAQIKCGNKEFYLGLHDTPQAAAVAYDRAASMMFGEFAVTNSGETE